MNNSVLQNWLVEIPIRMQSTLVLGLRGPDTHSTEHIKAITKWMRGLAFKPGNPKNMPFMRATFPGRIIEKGACAKELEFCTQHFVSHLMHSLEVIAYRHPDQEISTHAFNLFSDICTLFHLPVEYIEAFEERLKQIDWPQGQPDTFEEAMKQFPIEEEHV